MSVDTLRFAQLVSCGPGGCSPGTIDITYRDAALEFPESVNEKVARVWRDLSAEHERLFDGPMMSLYDVDPDTYRLDTERTSFRYYLTKLSILDGTIAPDEYGFTEDEIERLHDRLNVLSSFTAVVVDDHLLAGVRSSSPDDAPQISFPGSGYLDPSEDVSARGEVAPIRELVCREIEEELGITSGITEIRCEGVFEDVTDGHLVNPALFSEITVSRSRSDVEEASQTATDSWEFDRFVYLPIEEAFLSDVLTGAPAVSNDVTGLDRTGTLSPKACLMLFLVGQRRFGTSWGASTLETISIEIVEPEGF